MGTALPSGPTTKGRREGTALQKRFLTVTFDDLFLTLLPLFYLGQSWTIRFEESLTIIADLTGRAMGTAFPPGTAFPSMT